ncbi:hypothetical protein QR680_000290 [Steinernema hermaphroditum]|uniref:Uncharacterized protein n=1 Tax=Steinernema hermaphroditum TaxID=289476 RepID=A0AA39GVN6_9BILA|nr:hypothetical protein QR680_000290 [Steinernema hermaphroditum]
MLALFTISDAHVYAYSVILIAGSSYAYYDSISFLIWPLISFLFILPATNLLVNFGYVASNGPVLAFKQIAPITAGIGWALTWHIGERLYRQSLTAAQTLLYIIFSIRTRLDWALDCDHSYNNEHCRKFNDPNVTEYHSHNPLNVRHQPDNNWPAQQFNKFCIRGVDIKENVSIWQPNSWYYGHTNNDSIFPSVPLFCANIIVWLLVFAITRRDELHAGRVVSRICLIVPWLIYVVLLVYHTFFEFTFSETTEVPVTTAEVQKFPFVFFSDVYGFFSVSLAFINYSVAFSGMVIYASSRTRNTGRPLNVPVLSVLQMFIPMALYGLQHGCKGHLKTVQPAYDTYSGSDATTVFDTMGVCFANTSVGPMWAFLYYSATFLFNAIGPMSIFVMFIQNSLIEQFPSLEGLKSYVNAAICSCFALAATSLFTPMGTAFSTLFEYTTQSAVTQILAFSAIMFLCGWHKLDRSMNSLVGNASGTLVEFFMGHSSPIFSMMLFISVPMFLAVKYVSEFDLLLKGRDVQMHIEYAVEGLTPFSFINISFGYIIVFMPFAIIVNMALYAIYHTVRVEKMPLGSVFKETVHFGSPNTLGQNSDDAPLVTAIFKRCWLRDHVMVAILFIFETIVAVLLVAFFATYTVFHVDPVNPYRVLVIAVLLTLNIMSLMELKWLYSYWDSPYRMNFHIAVSTMETAFVNAYLLMVAFNHADSTGYVPLFIMLLHTFVRSMLISVAITLRSKLIQNRPSRTRDVTEIYDINNGLDDHGDDRDDDSPIVYNLS